MEECCKLSAFEMDVTNREECCSMSLAPQNDARYVLRCSSICVHSKLLAKDNVMG